MEVRDALEADAGRLASLTDAPRDVMRNLVHDRTVRVAYEPTDGDEASETASREGDEETGDAEGGPEPERETEAATSGDILGFVSFDARAQTVHVTQLEGDPDTYDRLLSEPVTFARTEAMAVELLVPEDEPDLAEAARAAGFDATGSGPRFGGQPTVRFRLDA